MAKKKSQNTSQSKNKKDKSNVNPFEIHINHSKFKILGQKSKDDRGLPGISRAKAFKKREKTLLHEYRDRHKNSKFMDKRIGENNPFLDPEKKMMMRLVAEKKKQFSKKSESMLNNDEELLHGGKSLSEDIMKDRSAFSDDDDDEDLLDASFVKDKHFGGDIFTKPKDGEQNSSGTKSRKEWIEDMIAESKKKKAETKMEKAIHQDAVSKLDAKFHDFISHMKGQIMTDEEKDKSKKNCEYRDYDTLVRQILFDRSRRARPADRLKSPEEIAKDEQQRLQKLEEDRQKRMLGHLDVNCQSQKSADALDDGWVMDASEPIFYEEKFNKTKSHIKTKTKAGKEEMKQTNENKGNEDEASCCSDAAEIEEEGEDEEEETEENGDGNEEIVESSIEVEESDEEIEEEEIEESDEKETVDEINEEKEELEESDEEREEEEIEESDDEKEEIVESSIEVEESDEEIEEEEIEESDEEKEEVEESDEEIEESDDEKEKTEVEIIDIENEEEQEESEVMDAEDEDTEGIDSYEEEEIEEELEQEKIIQKIIKPTSVMSKAEKISRNKSRTKSDKSKYMNGKLKTSDQNEEELPYTFEVPTEYDSFWELLENRTPDEVSTIIERMISCNHPSLGADNKAKANTIFTYILQTLHSICSVDPDLLKKDIHSLSYINSMIPHLYTLTQLNPNDCAIAFTEVIDEKYEEYTSNKPRRYPYFDTYVFLKIAGLLFPASDFHHDVMTRVLTFLTQVLKEAKVECGRDVVSLLFTASLLSEYLKRSRRFVGELMNALDGILYLSISKSKSNENLPVISPSRSWGPSSELLVLSEKYKICDDLPRLTLALINEEVSISESWKCTFLNEALSAMCKLCSIWTNLASVRAVFDPTRNLLERIPVKSYPDSIINSVETLKVAISGLPKQISHLKKEETVVKTLKMLEPSIEEVFEGVRKRGASRDSQETQKLLYKLKRERKGAKRELKRDSQFLARQQLKEVLEGDAERKKKVNLIMQGLATQESEYKKFKSKK